MTETISIPANFEREGVTYVLVITQDDAGNFVYEYAEEDPDDSPTG